MDRFATAELNEMYEGLPELEREMMLVMQERGLWSVEREEIQELALDRIYARTGTPLRRRAWASAYLDRRDLQAPRPAPAGGQAQGGQARQQQGPQGQAHGGQAHQQGGPQGQAQGGQARQQGPQGQAQGGQARQQGGQQGQAQGGQARQQGPQGQAHGGQARQQRTGRGGPGRGQRAQRPDTRTNVPRQPPPQRRRTAQEQMEYNAFSAMVDRVVLEQRARLDRLRAENRERDARQQQEQEEQRARQEAERINRQAENRAAAERRRQELLREEEQRRVEEQRAEEQRAEEEAAETKRLEEERAEEQRAEEAQLAADLRRWQEEQERVRPAADVLGPEVQTPGEGELPGTPVPEETLLQEEQRTEEQGAEEQLAEQQRAEVQRLEEQRAEWQHAEELRMAEGLRLWQEEQERSRLPAQATGQGIQAQEQRPRAPPQGRKRRRFERPATSEGPGMDQVLLGIPNLQRGPRNSRRAVYSGSTTLMGRYLWETGFFQPLRRFFIELGMPDYPVGQPPILQGGDLQETREVGPSWQYEDFWLPETLQEGDPASTAERQRQTLSLMLEDMKDHHLRYDFSWAPNLSSWMTRLVSEPVERAEGLAPYRQQAPLGEPCRERRYAYFLRYVQTHLPQVWALMRREGLSVLQGCWRSRQAPLRARQLRAGAAICCQTVWRTRRQEQFRLTPEQRFRAQVDAFGRDLEHLRQRHEPSPEFVEDVEDLLRRVLANRGYLVRLMQLFHDLSGLHINNLVGLAGQVRVIGDQGVVHPEHPMALDWEQLQRSWGIFQRTIRQIGSVSRQMLSQFRKQENPKTNHHEEGRTWTESQTRQADYPWINLEAEESGQEEGWDEGAVHPQNPQLKRRKREQLDVYQLPDDVALDIAEGGEVDIWFGGLSGMWVRGVLEPIEGQAPDRMVRIQSDQGNQAIFRVPPGSHWVALPPSTGSSSNLVEDRHLGRADMSVLYNNQPRRPNRFLTETELGDFLFGAPVSPRTQARRARKRESEKIRQRRGPAPPQESDSEEFEAEPPPVPQVGTSQRHGVAGRPQAQRQRPLKRAREKPVASMELFEELPQGPQQPLRFRTPSEPSRPPREPPIQTPVVPDVDLNEVLGRGHRRRRTNILFSPESSPPPQPQVPRSPGVTPPERQLSPRTTRSKSSSRRGESQSLGASYGGTELNVEEQLQSFFREEAEQQEATGPPETQEPVSSGPSGEDYQPSQEEAQSEDFR